MRRRIDALELAKLAHRNEDPLRSPLDHMADFARSLAVLFFVAVLGVVALAFTLADIPGVIP